MRRRKGREVRVSWAVSLLTSWIVAQQDSICYPVVRLLRPSISHSWNRHQKPRRRHRIVHMCVRACVCARGPTMPCVLPRSTRDIWPPWTRRTHRAFWVTCLFCMFLCSLLLPFQRFFRLNSALPAGVLRRRKKFGMNISLINEANSVQVTSIKLFFYT